MFLENKYTKWYFQIIENRINNPLPDDQYGEKHHIQPRCMGGDDSFKNIVKLSAREHFICHMILPRMVKNGRIMNKLIHAGMMMKTCTGKQQRYFNSRLYSALRLKYGEANKGENSDTFGKKWMYNPETDISKFIIPENIKEYIDAGWVIGRDPNHSIKISKSKSGKIVVNKDGKTKHVDPSELSNYEESGWTRGMSENQRSSRTGRKAIYNLKTLEQKNVNPDEAEKLIRSGEWAFGTSPNNQRHSWSTGLQFNWIHNWDLKECIQVVKDETKLYLEKGWEVGQVNDFNMYDGFTRREFYFSIYEEWVDSGLSMKDFHNTKNDERCTSNKLCYWFAYYELNVKYKKCWITNGQENKMIRESVVDNFVKEGWVRGKFHK